MGPVGLRKGRRADSEGQKKGSDDFFHMRGIRNGFSAASSIPIGLYITGHSFRLPRTVVYAFLMKPGEIAVIVTARVWIGEKGLFLPGLETDR